ncbi:MAG: hypothetical protein WC699_06375 [Bacteroidales bacterium]|jgi:hypothetical protein
MKRTLFLSILLMTALGFTGCMKNDCGRDEDPYMTEISPVMFQYEYVNYAWGFRHHGFLIDDHGYINGFDQPSKWLTPDSTGMLDREDLEYNLRQCDTVCGKVNIDDLRFYYRKIENVRNGKIRDNGLVMTDAGTGVLSAWYWNERAHKYENVFLVSNGDVSKINLHPDVNAMVEWLKTVGEKTGRFYWFGGL